MTVVETVGLDEPDRWRALLAGIPHGFGHTWESCYAYGLTTGYRTFLLHGSDAGTTVVCPLVERPVDGETDLSTPPGFSGFAGTGAMTGLPAAWARFTREHGYVCGHVALNPLFDDPSFTDSRCVRLVKHVHVLDLADDVGDLWRRLSVNRRRQLRGWHATQHTRDREELTAFFLEHFPGFMRRRHASSEFDLTRETLQAICAAPNVFLLGHPGSGELEAVSLFGFTPHAGDFLFNVSIGDGSRHSAGLLWSAVHLLKEACVPSLNLGGGLRDGDSLSDFKARFGGRVLPLRALKEVYRADAYAELCSGYGVDASDLDGYFPPYRAVIGR